MYEKIPIRDLVYQLKADTKNGLSEQEAAERKIKYGENKLIQAPPKTVFAMFIEQLNDPLIFILFIAAAISMLLREMSDMFIILTVICMNAIVGVVQEGKAQKALEALKKMTSPLAAVKRGGHFIEIEAKDLVPGDLVVLEAGRQVPADIRLIASSSLKVEESALTGESAAVDKDAAFLSNKELLLGDRKNIVFMSTNIIYGRGEGIVIASGMDTEIGKIAGMINDAEQESTPLQKRLGDMGKLLSIVAVLLCLALFAIALFQKRDIGDMLITAISLAVAAVPEGLPAVVTIVLALSVTKMVKVNTIVRRLPSVETLGSVSIVCSDKTGTLTQNKMKVMECYTDGRAFGAKNLDSNRHSTFIEGFILCNDAVIDEGNTMGDPTEIAFLEMARNVGVDKKELEHRLARMDELPFDSERKMMTTLHKKGTQTVSYTKGSVDELLKRCTHILQRGKAEPISQSHKKEIRHVMERMASNALRVLGLAMRTNVSRPEEKNLVFVGLAGMIDPPRPEASHAISQFKEASVTTVMITGDHIDTAYAIARDLGIVSSMEQCISGQELDALSDMEFLNKIQTVRVFARVSPQHKVRIVKAYKSIGKIVAMTGDGVNDAPSLKAADIGIAMGMNGTDVAKNASDIILTDDNFATIEKAIEEGRGVYENIKKSVLFLLSSNFGEIITMFLAILAGMASPLKASHILWVNLITDSLPALALGVDENDKKILMRKPPRDPKESLFAHGGLACTLFYGCLIAFLSLGAFMLIPLRVIHTMHLPFSLDTVRAILSNQEILARSQTYAFTVLGLSELFHAVGMRNVEQYVFKMNHRANKLMITAFFLGIILQVAVTEIPYLVTLFGTAKLSLQEWMHLIGLSAAPLLAHELLVLLTRLFTGKSLSTGNKALKEKRIPAAD